MLKHFSTSVLWQRPLRWGIVGSGVLLRDGSFKSLGLLEGEWFFVQLMTVQVELIVECCDSSLAPPIVHWYCPRAL